MISFTEAKNWAMPFGKFKGKTIDQIATSDSGLRYLDWLYGEMCTSTNKTPTLDALQVYLQDPTIAKELEGIHRK